MVICYFPIIFTSHSAKAKSCIFAAFGTVISFNASQKPNAWSPIDVIVTGKITFFSPSQPQNALASIAVTPAGILISVSEVQPSNDDFEVKDGVLVEYSGDGKVFRVPDGVEAIGNSAFDCSAVESVGRLFRLSPRGLQYYPLRRRNP